MGANASNFFNLDTIEEYVEIKRQVVSLNDRLAELERNYTNVTVRVIQNQEITAKLQEDLMAITLMEEGRLASSIYK